MSENVQLVVQFTQKFTVTAPSCVDKVGAHEWWLQNETEDLRDVLDPHQGEAEVLHIREGDDD